MTFNRAWSILIVIMFRAHPFFDNGESALPPLPSAGAEAFDSLLPLPLVGVFMTVDAVLTNGAEVDITGVQIFLSVNSLDDHVVLTLGKRVSTSALRIVFCAFHVDLKRASKLGRDKTRSCFFLSQVCGNKPKS